MLATLIIVFREMIEAGLVVGIIMAATLGVPARGKYVSLGILWGVAGACLVALFADNISNALEGIGQEMFNASVLLLAVLMLIWHNVWMARHGRQLVAEMKEVGRDVASGKRSLVALSVVVGLAVLREGSEVVLFLYGIALSGNDSMLSMLLGGLLGLGAGATISTLIYLGLLHIPNRYLFGVTSWLVAFLAAGMAAQAVIFLQQSGVIEIGAAIMWDSSFLISDQSIAGRILHALIGYVAEPNQMQLATYAGTLAVIIVLTQLCKPAAVAKA